MLPFLSWVIEDALPVLLSLLSDLFTFLSENPQVLVDLTELVVAFIAAWKLASVISALSKLNFQVVSLTFIFGVFLTLILDIAGAWKDMSGLEKVISVLGLLVTAAAVAAIAVGALQSALTMGVAAIAIAAGITAIVAAVNSATNRANKATASISSGGRSISGYSSTELSSIPHLASGAVISPNSEFLAVLGDQRSGTNIETPLATMKQAFMEAISEMGGVGGETAVNITFDGSLAQLARILEPKISVESGQKRSVPGKRRCVLMAGLFTVDGVSYKVRVPAGGLTRSFQVLDGKNAGRLLSGTMEPGYHRDVLQLSTTESGRGRALRSTTSSMRPLRSD